MVIALGVAVLMNVFAYWNADSIVLRMHGAREIGRADLPWFHGMVGQLAERAGLPMPRVYLIEQEQPNAFATGPNPANSAVAAPPGMLRRPSHQEIAGGWAHARAPRKN